MLRLAKYELRQSLRPKRHIRLRSELQRSAAPPVLTMGPSVLARAHTARTLPEHPCGPTLPVASYLQVGIGTPRDRRLVAPAGLSRIMAPRHTPIMTAPARDHS